MKIKFLNQDRIRKITDYIFLKSKPQKVDLAIVFGTRYLVPIKKVFEIYRKNLVSKILVSGGKNNITGKKEALVMHEGLIKLGVKKEHILTEKESTNSLENVLFSKTIIENKIGFKNVKKIIAVVKHYHSRRALMTLKKHFPRNIELIPVSYNIHGFTKNNWFNNKKGREKVMDEWTKIKKYLKKGDIEEL
jgi:uncharacterized SAM-binding protein YcdF (DUF218 family)